MFLDKRKRMILQTIIDDYIDTAEPIGSRTIARKHELGLSSATIRNEMSDLEEMGYLAQPHTSAGRVPSVKGYRLYVDELMKLRELSARETELIKDALQSRINELGDIIKHASAVLSRVTEYTSMAVTPNMNRSKLKAVQVVPVDSGKALIVAVTNTGVVRNCIVRISESLTPDALIRISNILNDKLSGLTLEQINTKVIREIEKLIGAYSENLKPILDGVKNCIDQVDNNELYIDGTTKIFNHPEFRDIVKARELLDIMDAKDLMARLLRSTGENGEIRVRIGSENELDEIKDCSLITASYSLEDALLGTIGVIGPIRMDYAGVIASLRYISKMLNRELLRLVDEELE